MHLEFHVQGPISIPKSTVVTDIVVDVLYKFTDWEQGWWKYTCCEFRNSLYVSMSESDDKHCTLEKWTWVK